MYEQTLDCLQAFSIGLYLFVLVVFLLNIGWDLATFRKTNENTLLLAVFLSAIGMTVFAIQFAVSQLWDTAVPGQGALLFCLTALTLAGWSAQEFRN